AGGARFLEHDPPCGRLLFANSVVERSPWLGQCPPRRRTGRLTRHAGDPLVRTVRLSRRAVRVALGLLVHYLGWRDGGAPALEGDRCGPPLLVVDVSAHVWRFLALQPKDA